jgi:hypothetical protein
MCAIVAFGRRTVLTFAPEPIRHLLNQVVARLNQWRVLELPEQPAHASFHLGLPASCKTERASHSTQPACCVKQSQPRLSECSKHVDHIGLQTSRPLRIDSEGHVKAR